MANWAADDDDAPPPLSSLAEQVEALHVSSAADRAAQRPQEAGPRVASCVIASSEARSAGQLPAATATAKLKKGFFDSKPERRKPAAKDEGITVLKGRKDALGGQQGGKAIPDFLRVEPDEQELKYKEMRSKLVEALKPDRDTIDKIASDKQLSTAFEDPEVMAAVNDIAQHPQNWNKYKDNKKVLAFYSAMGSLMGQRLEGMGPSQPGAGGASASSAGSGSRR